MLTKTILPSVIMKISKRFNELVFFVFIKESFFVERFRHFSQTNLQRGSYSEPTTVQQASGDAKPVDNQRNSQNIPPSWSRSGNPR